MCCLVVTHQKKGPILIPLGQPFQRHISIHIRGMALTLTFAFRGFKARIKIRPLPARDGIIIKAVCIVSVHMPLANHSGLIPGLLQDHRQCGFTFGVEFFTQSIHAMLVAVLARENAGTARRTQRICAHTVREHHAFSCQTVNMRRARIRG